MCGHHGSEILQATCSIMQHHVMVALNQNQQNHSQVGYLKKLTFWGPSFVQQWIKRLKIHNQNWIKILAALRSSRNLEYQMAIKTFLKPSFLPTNVILLTVVIVLTVVTNVEVTKKYKTKCLKKIVRGIYFLETLFLCDNNLLG